MGADNLAENLLRLGLNVVRVGKASGVSPSLWDHTLDAAIDKDPDAQKALRAAAKATANVRNLQSNTKNGKKGMSTRSRVGVVDLRNKREAATRAVKASIQVRIIFFFLTQQLINYCPNVISQLFESLHRLVTLRQPKPFATQM